MGYPWCYKNPRVHVVWVCTHTRMGTGFAGTGVGWTSRTRTIPVCHPMYEKGVVMKTPSHPEGKHLDMFYCSY